MLNQRNICINKTGFTIMEASVMLLIVSAIAGVAIPTFFVSIEKSRASEAQATLHNIRLGEKVYAASHNNNYWLPGANPDANTINTTLGLQINPRFYNVTSINGTNGLTLVAKRNATSGGDNSTTYTMALDGTITKSVAAAPPAPPCGG